MDNNSKKWIILLGILNLLVVVLIIFFLVQRDNDGPKIEGPLEGEYRPEMTKEELLTGITAYDEKDGDVTHTLVVEKVLINKEKSSATISCGAKDSAGNISRKTFKRTAILPVEEETTEEETEEAFVLEAGEAANHSENEDAEIEEAEEEVEEPEEEEAEEEQAEEPAEPEEAEGDENPEEEVAEEKPAEEAQVPKGAAPSISFSQGEVKTAVGMTPAWVTVIGRLEDDKTSYEELLGSISIHGEYKVNEKGSYPVTVTVKDKDGNESAPAAIKIIVEG